MYGNCHCYRPVGSVFASCEIDPRSILSFGIFFRGKMPPEDLPLNSVVL